jgi:hypothetical protein
MVSLHIPAIAKAIEDASPPEAYIRLRNRGYLSIRGLLNRERVIALIQETIQDYPDTPMLGQELSRNIVTALVQAGYVSLFGRTWGMLGRSRG